MEEALRKDLSSLTLSWSICANGSSRSTPRLHAWFWQLPRVKARRASCPQSENVSVSCAASLTAYWNRADHCGPRRTGCELLYRVSQTSAVQASRERGPSPGSSRGTLVLTKKPNGQPPVPTKNSTDHHQQCFSRPTSATRHQCRKIRFAKYCTTPSGGQMLGTARGPTGMIDLILESQPMQEGLETRSGAQSVQLWIDLGENDGIGTILVGLLDPV
jgi:hypothetical protein